jgi:hypothetical protein
MKKTIWIVGLVVVALAVFGAGAVYAQGPMPHNGILHTYMVAAFADELGLKTEDVNARITAGESMYDVALASGVQAEDFPALMLKVRSQALSAAMKDGVITQAQADQMNSHNCPMLNGNGGAGRMHGNGQGMMNGNGQGMMGNYGW